MRSAPRSGLFWTQAGLSDTSSSLKAGWFGNGNASCAAATPSGLPASQIVLRRGGLLLLPIGGRSESPSDGPPYHQAVGSLASAQTLYLSGPGQISRL